MSEKSKAVCAMAWTEIENWGATPRADIRTKTIVNKYENKVPSTMPATMETRPTSKFSMAYSMPIRVLVKPRNT